MRELLPIDGAALSAAIPAAIRQLLDRLAERAATWLVGGTVRDLWLGRPSRDVDVAVAVTPERLRTSIGSADGFTGTSFDDQLGVANMVAAATGHDLAVSAFRSEADYGADRRPRRVEFGVDLDRDAQRRDFTINAAYVAWPDGAVVDPCGAREDLRSGLLRVVGPAESRLAEDPLRVLRGLRFLARYGLRPEPMTRDALRTVAPRCADLVPGRQFGELSCMLVMDGERAWRSLREYGVLAVLLPELVDVVGDVRLDEAPADPAARWAALGVAAGPDRLEEVLVRLNAPRQVRRDAVAVSRLAVPARRQDPQRVVAGVSPDWLTEALPRLMDVERARRLLAVLRGSGGHPGEPLVAAARLRAEGVPAGPALGVALRELRCALAAGKGEPEPEEVTVAIRDAVAAAIKEGGAGGR